jgi:hypothetical protein
MKKAVAIMIQCFVPAIGAIVGGIAGHFMGRGPPDALMACIGGTNMTGNKLAVTRRGDLKAHRGNGKTSRRRCKVSEDRALTRLNPLGHLAAAKHISVPM